MIWVYTVVLQIPKLINQLICLVISFTMQYGCVYEVMRLIL